MKKLKIFCCPRCGETTAAYGCEAVECCGERLLPLTPDGTLTAKAEEIDGETVLTFDSPMTKENYIAAVVEERYDRVTVSRLFAEQEPLARVAAPTGGKVYAVLRRSGCLVLLTVTLTAASCQSPGSIC